MKKKVIFLNILLLTTFISCIVISGTYAKYISSFDIADEARVAKWKFTVNGKTDNVKVDLFRESYPVDANSGEEYVKSSEPGVKVVAPGTEGSYRFTLVGTSETNFKYKVVPDRENSFDNTNGKLKFYLYKVNYNDDGSEILTEIRENRLSKNTLEDLWKAFEKSNSPTVFAPSKDRELMNFEIHWKWDFEAKDSVTGSVEDNDKSDTELGIAATGENAPRVKLAFKIVSEQTQEAVTE